MRSLIVPDDAFCFEADGLHLSVCPARNGRDLQQRGGELAVHEARHNLRHGCTNIIALIVEPAALLQAASFIKASPRLMAVAWDAGGLAKALHAQEDSETMRQARSLVLMAARAAGVLALDSASPDLTSEKLRQACFEARRDGFNGKLAASQAQQALIEAAFA